MTRPIALTTALIFLSITTSFFFNGRDIDMYAISGIAAIVAFVFTVLSTSYRTLNIGPIGAFLTLYVIWNVFAIMWSQVPYMSIVEAGTLGSAFALFLVWRMLPLEYANQAIRFLLLALGFAFATVLIGQYVTGAVPRVTFPNPNSAAGFMNLLWPAAAIGWLHEASSRRSRTMYITLVLLLALAIGIQGSRGALIGSVVALSVILYIGITTLKRPRQSLTLATVFFVSLIGANLLGDYALQSEMGSITESGPADSGRFTIWAATWEMIQERPWLGFGPGLFWLAYPAYRHPSDESAGMFAHNDYLEFWLETGIPGLLLIVLLGFASIFALCCTIKAYRTNSYNNKRLPVATACFAAIAGVAAHSVFTFNLQMMPFILVVSILLAHMETTSGAGVLLRVPLAPLQRRLLPMVSIIALSLIPIGHFARTSAAFSEIETGSHHLARDEYDAAAATFSTASALWSQIDTPWYMHANTLLEGLRANKDLPADKKRELVHQARSLLDEAEKRNPLRANAALVRGLLRADHPEWTNGSAQESLRKALALDPRNIEARYALSQVLENQGDTEEALDVVEKGLTIDFGDGMNITPLYRRAEQLRRADPIDTETPSGTTREKISLDPGPIQAGEGATRR